MSHHRKNSVRDKVIGEKWFYSDAERSTFYRVWPSQRASAVAMECGVVSLGKLGDFLC